MCLRNKSSASAHILSQRKVSKLKKQSLLQQLLDRSDLPDENLPGKPLIEILGESRILVENHQGITEYGFDQIGIRVCYGMVNITGRNLRLRHAARNKLLIVGKIDSVTLQRRQCQ